MRPATPDQVFTGARTLPLYALFLVSGLLVFLGGMTFAPVFAAHVSTALQIATTGLFLAAALLLRRNERLRQFWTLAFAFFIAASAILAMSVLGHGAMQVFAVSVDNPPGIATAKFIESCIAIATILVLLKLSRQKLSSAYWQAGRLKQGLTLGVVLFAGFVVLGILRLAGQDYSLARLLPLIPWILIFVFANGAMEELLFRGIFLKRCEPYFGTNGSNVLTAIVFSVAHMQVTYTADVPVFLVIVFFLGLGLGHVMQRTDSLIAPVLFHAGADIPFMVDIFANQGANI
ncbi:MAG: CPBP family intramembrane glutamic endopeptidase [Pseudomonadota bacterium]